MLELKRPRLDRGTRPLRRKCRPPGPPPAVPSQAQARAALSDSSPVADFPATTGPCWSPGHCAVGAEHRQEWPARTPPPRPGSSRACSFRENWVGPRMKAKGGLEEEAPDLAAAELMNSVHGLPCPQRPRQALTPEPTAPTWAAWCPQGSLASSSHSEHMSGGHHQRRLCSLSPGRGAAV